MSARALAEDTLARCRRVLGEDHPETLNAATNLAADLRTLGEARAARELDEDTLTRRRRVLAKTTSTPWRPPPTSLPICARWARQQLHACTLDEDALTRRRRASGRVLFRGSQAATSGPAEALGHSMRRSLSSLAGVALVRHR